MTVAELAARMGRGEPAYNLTQGLPIVSDDGKLVGIVTQGDLLRALEAGSRRSDDGSRGGSNQPIVAYPDELVHDAMYRMLQHNIGRLPVVSRENPQQMVGYFNRASLLGAWTRQMRRREAFASTAGSGTVEKTSARCTKQVAQTAAK